MKKMIVTGMILAGMLAFAGCGKANDSAPAESSVREELSVTDESTDLSVEEPEEDTIQDVVWETSNEDARVAFNAWLADISNAKEWAEMSVLDSLSFIAVDLNGVPTMFVENEAGVHHDMERVYVYKDGQVENVIITDGVTAVYPQDGVIVTEASGMGEILTEYYQITETGDCTKIAECQEEIDLTGDADSTQTYSVNGSSDCTQEEFNAFIENTVAHSKKYEKIFEMLLQNNNPIREDYFKIQHEDTSNNTMSEDTTSGSGALADGEYYPFFIGDKDRADAPGVESTDTVFSWLEIGGSTMKINMDLGSGMQVYEIALASDVKFMEGAEDDWEISADQLNNSFGTSGTLYGFNIRLVVENGQVKEIWTFS